MWNAWPATGIFSLVCTVNWILSSSPFWISVIKSHVEWLWLYEWCCPNFKWPISVVFILTMGRSFGWFITVPLILFDLYDHNLYLTLIDRFQWPKLIGSDLNYIWNVEVAILSWNVNWTNQVKKNSGYMMSFCLPKKTINNFSFIFNSCIHTC